MGTEVPAKYAIMRASVENNDLVFNNAPTVADLQNEWVSYIVFINPALSLTTSQNIGFQMNVEFKLNYVFSPLVNNTFANHLADEE